MYLKHLTVFSILVCGQCAWKYYDTNTTQVQKSLDGYKLVGETLHFDGENSVTGLDRVYLPRTNSTIPSGLFNLTNFEKVDSGRVLKFGAHIKASELLLPGELLFMKKRREVLLKARAHLYGQDECNRLKASIASACKVKDMEISNDEQDLIHIDYEFGFVQKAEFGDVDENSNLTYDEEHIQFYQLLNRSKISLEEQEETRFNYYDKIVSYCKKIRWFLGTCAINTIDFHYISMDKSDYSMDALEVNVHYTSLVSLESQQVSQKQ